MSIIEDRLRDALNGVGATVGTHELRGLQAEKRRRVRFDVRYLAGAVAVAAALSVGVVTWQGRSPDGEVAAMSALVFNAATRADVSVFLCRKEADPTCGGRHAAPNEAEAILERLKSLPEIQEIAYEDQAAAYENFMKDPESDEHLKELVQVWEMPASFRITLRPGASSRGIFEEVGGQPGVSSVVDHRCVLGGGRRFEPCQ